MAEGEKSSASVSKQTLRRIAGLFLPYRRRLVLTLVAVLVGVGLGIAPPFFLQRLIDLGIQKGDLGVVVTNSILTMVTVLGAAGVTLLYGYWSVVIGQEIMCDLRRKLFEHLQSMSLKFFTSTRTGEIQTRLLSDVAGVQGVVSNTITDQISNIAIVLSTAVAMFVLDYRLTLLSIGMVPGFALIGKWVGEFARNVRKGTQEQTAELNSMMQETLSVSGVLLTKTTGRLDTLLTRFDVENHKLAGWQVQSTVLQYVFFAMIRVITQLAPSLVFWLAGWLLISQGDHSITVGKLIAFTGLQARLFFPMTGLLSAQVEIMSSFALFDRIFEYMDLPIDILEKPAAVAVECGEAKGAIRYENVDFYYEPELGKKALDGISFEALPGQLVALVGPSGAGKTTLTYLLPRLYDPDAGKVTLDGVDLKDLKLSSLSQLVGAVTQETYLLHTTIVENLRVARPDASLPEIEEACKAAAIHDHIASLPEGYETIVGERGYKLSGGEKQRLAIARAILKNPKVLILDEATSALDTASERLIQNSLSQLMKGRTTFAIAHRLSTILAADQILVMDRGRIVERGTHDELLKVDGLYAMLYKEQFASEAAMA